MPGFVHVDIGVEDPERAARFYSRVFGWDVTKLEGPMPYWLVTPTGGIVHSVESARGEQAKRGGIPTIEVDSADAISELVIREGGQVLTPKAAIPGVGQLVTFRDSEGNVLGALEPERPAAPRHEGA